MLSHFLEDVLLQPAELKRAVAYYKSDEVQSTLEKIKNLSFGEIIISGMGSSHFCALSADVYLSSHDIRSRVVSTAELLYYERQRINNDTLLCLISQSGESAEIVRLLDTLPQDFQVLAITNNPDSTLGRRGNIVLNLHVSNEESVSTRTYVASVMMSMIIAQVMTGVSPEKAVNQMDDILTKLEDYLDDYKKVYEKLDEFSHDVNSVLVMGRGYSLSTVRASALFLREASRSAATDFDSAEFRHGPMEMIENGVFAVVFAPSGITQDLQIKMADDLAEAGANVVLITDEQAKIDDKPEILRLNLPTVDECMIPILQILPMQLLTDCFVVRKGLTSGEFKWGTKITVIE